MSPAWLLGPLRAAVKAGRWTDRQLSARSAHQRQSPETQWIRGYTRSNDNQSHTSSIRGVFTPSVSHDGVSLSFKKIATRCQCRDFREEKKIQDWALFTTQLTATAFSRHQGHHLQWMIKTKHPPLEKQPFMAEQKLLNPFLKICTLDLHIRRENWW